MGARRRKPAVKPLPQWRHVFVLAILGTLIGLLATRAFELQMLEHDRLQDQADKRHLRSAPMVAQRGDIRDRNGEPLAISTAMSAIAADPRHFQADAVQLQALASLLGSSASALRQRVQAAQGRHFVYLKRPLPPSVGKAVDALNIEGVFSKTEYRRFYPAGEVTAHLVGFTGRNHHGQEGLELALEEKLSGQPGSKKVMFDGHGQSIAVDLIEPPVDGDDVQLSIDLRLQYLAYRELKRAVRDHHAVGGSAVLLDARNGDVLALVNSPSFNPNSRDKGKAAQRRNRAITDVFEPGSTMKPFAILGALEAGIVGPHTPIDTSPGIFKVGGKRVTDHRDYGILDAAGVLRHSSNIGASKLALAQSASDYEAMLRGLGFGASTGSGFPGEVHGSLAPASAWSTFKRATLAYGYGLDVTALQLAQAYLVLAGDGRMQPVKLLVDADLVRPQRLFSASSVKQLRRMLAGVVEQGTGKMAALERFSVAGKTGTVHKAVRGGYSKDRYRALFAGMAPVDHPRLVLVVMVDEPRTGDYYGGLVAAPVFHAVMGEALRILNIAPDKAGDSALRLASHVGEGVGQ